MNNIHSHNSNVSLSFFTLLLLISFASVNAVLFTPALPEIAQFFQINEKMAEQTITWFLIGYTLGQLLYGPIANRYGRKPALYLGISIQIISCFICVLSANLHAFWVLILGRFCMAIGSGVGLKMTFTLVNECYEPKEASQKISYLMLAFAITPGLGVALGGLLTTYFSWTSCFYASAIYGLWLLFLVTKLPETMKNLDKQALNIRHLMQNYGTQFKNQRLISGGLLMGSTSCFIYIFAAITPFIAINLYHMQSSAYGLANLLPSIGLIFGSLIGAKLVNKFTLKHIVTIGVLITTLSTIIMFATVYYHLPILIGIFVPAIFIYFGLCLIMPNISTLTMMNTKDKAHGSAVMSFLNMGTATIGVLGINYLTMTSLLLPFAYMVLCVVMFGLFVWFNQTK